MPIQQMLLGTSSAVATKTYVDDIFSTFLYAGNSTSQSINNGIDLAGKGGMVWAKRRSGSQNHILADTVRGITKYLNPNNAAAEVTDQERFLSVSSTGFAVGDEVDTNGSGSTYASWTLRKAPGFFDIVTYTGNDTNRTIAHSLGCVPGMIFIKNLTDAEDWVVYHRDLTATHYVMLQSTSAQNDDNYMFNDTEPTASVFSLGTEDKVNKNGSSYVAYLFAGGESTAATARSIYFDGDEYFDTATSSDLDIGTGDFTIEFWVNFDDVNSSLECILETRSGGGATSDGIMLARWHTSSHENKVSVYMNGFLCEEKGSTPNGQWNHFAVVRSSGTTSLYKNGTFEDSFSDSNNWSNTSWNIGCLANEEGTYGNAMHGSISNFRFVKGTAVYTSSFKPPTEPLTNITNTKLLCCQSSTVTASTGVTLSASGNPTASTDSPFDDPAGFVFGENEDQNVIKCGSYKGNGSTGTNANDIYLGFEPQWLLIKSSSKSDTDWMLLNSMSGIPGYNGYSPYLRANSSTSEKEDDIRLQVTSTGFSPTDSEDTFNKNGETYIFCAIRRPDGYVGKPADAGTDVFAIDTGNGSSTIPVFDSGFPVDMALYKYQVTGSADWVQTSRLQGIKRLIINSTNAEGSFSDFTWDSNVGWCKESSAGSGYYSWMWKRGAGFDVVTYTGNATAGRQIRHSLSKSPEMIWVKDRENTRDWRVFHHGLNGGSNPAQYGIKLNSIDEESQNSSYWNDTAPTSTSFTIGNSNNTNNSSTKYIAMLFASVDGISKVGYYDGSDSDQTITTGFQPRFIIIRRTNDQQDWVLLDTTRGWAQNTNDPRLEMNRDVAQNNNTDFGYPTSTGFVLEGGTGKCNQSGGEFIYYAHA